MKVWRKQLVQYFTKEGKRCPKGQSVRQKTIESKRFYGTLTLASGKRKQTPHGEVRTTAPFAPWTTMSSPLKKFHCQSGHLGARRSGGLTQAARGPWR